jgi:hypothetical protein
MALSKGGDDVEVIFTSPCRVEGTIIDNGEGKSWESNDTCNRSCFVPTLSLHPLC